MQISDCNYELIRMGILTKRLRQLREITTNLGFIDVEVEYDNGVASFTDDWFEINVNEYQIIIDVNAFAEYKDIESDFLNPSERLVKNKRLDFEIIKVQDEDSIIQFNKKQIEFLKNEIKKIIVFNP